MNSGGNSEDKASKQDASPFFDIIRRNIWVKAKRNANLDGRGFLTLKALTDLPLLPFPSIIRLFRIDDTSAREFDFATPAEGGFPRLQVEAIQSAFPSASSLSHTFLSLRPLCSRLSVNSLSSLPSCLVHWPWRIILARNMAPLSQLSSKPSPHQTTGTDDGSSLKM